MMGVLLLLAAVGLAVGFGLWRRVTDGTMRPAGHRPQRVRAVAVPAPVDLAAPRQAAPASDAAPIGSVRADEPVPGDGAVPAHGAAPEADEAVAVVELGRDLGERATLLQFSSAFCAPCRATRTVLSEVAGMVPGVAHIEIDAESHLDLVRRLDVRRTPTVFVLDPAGRIRRRAVGAPRRADVIAALGEVI